MILLGLLAGWLTLIAGGFGATLLLLRGGRQLNLAECAALSWLFGSGLVSLFLWIGGMIASGVALQLGVGAALLALAAAGVASARREHARISIPKPRNVLEWTLGAVIAVEILVMFYGAAAHGLGWDGLFNWEVKARYSFLNNGVIPAGYFSSGTREFTHPAYPLLIPLTELWLYLSMGEAHQFWIKFIFPLYYAAGAILLATAAIRLTAQRWAGLLSAALLFFVPILSNTPGTATGGYVDVPLGMLYLATVAYLLLFAVNGERAALRVYAASLALLPWAKREGAILWLVGAACSALVIWRGARRWRSLGWLLPGAVLFVASRIFLHAMQTNEAQDYAPSFAVLQANVVRIPHIGSMVAAEMLETQRWSLFWTGVMLALAYLACRRCDRRLLLLIIALAAPCMLYAASFVFSVQVDYAALFKNSFPRLLLHVMPVGWLAIALAIPWRAGEVLHLAKS